MKIEQFAVNEVVFYHQITTGDTVSLTLTNAPNTTGKTVNPVIQTRTDNWFLGQITTVTGQTQENLTGGTIYLQYGGGYYDYDLKINNISVETSQLFVTGPSLTVVEISGTTGYVVTNPYAGSSGSSGRSGTNGVSGTNGSSASSGLTGSSGTAGSTGSSGSSGTSGSNGSSASSGTSGTAGSTGSSGSSGQDGTGGESGSSGVSGSSGSSATSGVNGSSGSSGISGTNGLNGTGGESGSSGSSGQNGLSSTYYNYKTHTNSQAPPLASGRLEWNNATQTGSTQLFLSHITEDGNDIEVILGTTGIGSTLIIQDKNVSENYQRFTVTSVAVTVDSYVTFGVTYLNGGYSFSNNHDILVIVQSVGIAGTSGTSGATGGTGSSGSSGATGSSGSSGATGATGSSGSSGATGVSGTSGVSGSNGSSNIVGFIQTRAGQYNFTYSVGSSNRTITFGTPMPSTDYAVTFESYENSNNDFITMVSKSTTGFTFSYDSPSSATIEWMAIEYSSSGTNGIPYGSNGTSGATGSSGSSGLTGTAGTTGSSGSSGNTVTEVDIFGTRLGGMAMPTAVATTVINLKRNLFGRIPQAGNRMFLSDAVSPGDQVAFTCDATHGTLQFSWMPFIGGIGNYKINTILPYKANNPTAETKMRIMFYQGANSTLFTGLNAFYGTYVPNNFFQNGFPTTNTYVNNLGSTVNYSAGNCQYSHYFPLPQTLIGYSAVITIQPSVAIGHTQMYAADGTTGFYLPDGNIVMVVEMESTNSNVGTFGRLQKAAVRTGVDTLNCSPNWTNANNTYYGVNFNKANCLNGGSFKTVAQGGMSSYLPPATITTAELAAMFGGPGPAYGSTNTTAALHTMVTFG